jgi:hypothetical protein
MSSGRPDEPGLGPNLVRARKELGAHPDVGDVIINALGLSSTADVVDRAFADVVDHVLVENEELRIRDRFRRVPLAHADDDTDDAKQHSDRGRQQDCAADGGNASGRRHSSVAGTGIGRQLRSAFHVTPTPDRNQWVGLPRAVPPCRES